MAHSCAKCNHIGTYSTGKFQQDACSMFSALHHLFKKTLEIIFVVIPVIFLP